MPSNRPAQYQRSTNITRSRQATIARQDEALRLRRSGLSYIDIARRLGWTPNGVARPQSAAEAVRAAQRREALTNGAIASVAVTPTDFPSIPSTRTFGIECEFFGINVATALAALHDAGFNAEFERYHANTVPAGFWKVTTDGSVTSRGTGTSQGLEMVSPILQGQQGFDDAIKAVKALLNAGAKVDKTCGLHVHLGMDGLTGADLIKVVEVYTANTANINKVVASSRHNTRWARKQDLSASYLSPFKNATDSSQIKALSSNIPHNERYHAVNLKSYSAHGTVEFRQHQGTLNAEKVVSWVKFVMALTEKAVTTSDTSVEFGSFPELLDNLPLANETKQFLGRRADALATSR